MFSNIKNNIRKRPFVRNVFIMATGAASAQVVTLALSPIITRLYGPEAFGLLGVFTALIMVISPIAALTYPIAIVLPKSDREALGLAKISLYISLILSILVAFLILIFNQPIVSLLKVEIIGPFLYFVPLVIIFSGFLQVVEQWFIRKKHFKINAKATFLQAVFQQGSRIGIGLLFPFASILIITLVFSLVLKGFMMTKWGEFKYKALFGDDLKQISLKMLAKKYRDFPLFRAPQSFIDAVTQSLPILMLTSFFGAAAVGLFTLSKTVLNVPTNFIGKSVGDVFYPRISEAANNGENLLALLLRATLLLSLIGIVPYALVFFFGPYIFGFVFGEEWIKAGEYAKWVAVWSYSTFVLQPSLKALPVLGAQAFHLYFTVLSLVIRIIILFIAGYIFSNDLVAVALFGVSSGLLNILLILSTLFKSKNYSIKHF